MISSINLRKGNFKNGSMSEPWVYKSHTAVSQTFFKNKAFKAARITV